MPSPCGHFTFRLNGETLDVAEIAPQTHLLDFVRSRGLTGAKEGCAEGECGACAVLLVREVAGRTTLLAANSCLIPLPMVADAEVYTVEGLADAERLAEVQQAMVDLGGSQCGYCTPGFIVSMFAGHASRQGAESLGGNLCRCTGYRPIREAMESLRPMASGYLFERLAKPAPQIATLSYENDLGRFSRPDSLAGCLALAAADPEACFVAGNTDLGVMTNIRLQRFRHLISVEGVPELREFHEDDASVEIGAALTLTEIEALWTSAPPVFEEWLELFGSVLIRNRATLGGNLVTASPIGDSAPLLLALGAEVRLSRVDGERVVPLVEFFRDYRQTALEPGELLRSIRIPKPLPAQIRFYKVAKRRMDDISTVAACFSMGSQVRLAFGGVAAIPLRVPAAEQILEESMDWDNAMVAIGRSLSPLSDHRGSAAYRSAMAQSLLDKFRTELPA
ncbi:MAG TPA: FAD binding domain-containing protein [Bryobacteraceae bacterium]|nr:FAD binding domain-containing protein [Bryobacteraceae bacterium]